MPYKDKEYSKQHYKEYREKNKEKIRAREKAYQLKNREERNAKFNLYRKANHKTYKINEWKRANIIDTDWDLLYDIFMKETNCWICGIEFDDIYKRKCLDHDHDTGECRYICCSYCNLHTIG